MRKQQATKRDFLTVLIIIVLLLIVVFFFLRSEEEPEAQIHIHDSRTLVTLHALLTQEENGEYHLLGD